VLEQRGATQVAVIAADLPWLTVEDVGCLIGAAAAGSVAFAPDRHGTGTNALALRLPARFAFQFGAGSLARHRAAAAALGLETVNVERTGLAFDVDEPEDVTLLRERAAAGYAFLS
jgi:2-phospho-L-lactate/phosphoenolpyruvate guanylyltransferase